MPTPYKYRNSTNYIWLDVTCTNLTSLFTFIKYMPREMICGQGHKIIQISLPPAGQQDNSNVLPQGPRRSIKSLSYSWSPPAGLTLLGAFYILANQT